MQQPEQQPDASSNLQNACIDARRFLRGLYVITDERLSDHIGVARAAIEGGATIVQLRDKTTPLSRLLPIALEIRRLTWNRAAFIINDRCDLAWACDADGVHLGPDDLPLDVARRMLGPDKILGASCNGEIEARQAQLSGADYIGAGAVFATATKSDAGAPIGTETLRRIVESTSLPVAAIGGLNPGNIAQAKQSGAIMMCVVSAVCAAGDEAAMTQATQELVKAAA